MAQTVRLKSLACGAIEKYSELLNEVSQKIWKNPELNFEEKFAHALLTDVLSREGFAVSRGYPLDTSFVASFGTSDGPCIGLICEYDALPEIGHACGHNLIAETGLAAALGVKSVLQKHKECHGKVMLFGTPAEELGDGKCILLEKGVFDEIDVCLMVHPAHVDILDGSKVFLALLEIYVTYFGKASHASAQPWEGKNALDAAITCYASVSMMRQQIKPSCRVHGVISDGGKRPNIIPEMAKLEYNLRATSFKDLEDLKRKFLDCVSGAAKVTGCTYKIDIKTPTCLNMLGNQQLTQLYRDNVTSLGLKEADPQTEVLASSDCGNVSYHRPTIQPLFAIPTTGFLHTEKFQEAAGSPQAQPAALRAGKAMAMTAIDLLCDSTLISGIAEEFKKAKEQADN